MPICNKCNSNFPNHQTIDGKRRNLQRRKYCVTCSPLGGRNTRKLELPSLPFSKQYRYMKKIRLGRKAKLVEEHGGGCKICKYNRCARSLDFHHVNENEKSFSLAGRNMADRTWDKIKEEAKKCVLLCRNCHGEVHSGLHSDLENDWKKKRKQALGN